LSPTASTSPSSPQNNPTNRTRSITNPYRLNTNYHSRERLHHWLQEARRSTNHTKTPPDNNNQTQPIPQPHHQPIQTTLNTATDNEHWGDIIPTDTQPGILRVISKNVNSLNTDDDFIEWKAAIDAMAELQASVVCLQETNICWKLDIHHRIRQIIQDTNLQTSHINTSHTNEYNKFTTYQPGGTFIATFGPWVSHIHQSGNDASGMGRWSYLEFQGRSDQQIIIASGYRACPQNPRLGSMTYYDQQYRILLAAGHSLPDPREQFVTDLIAQVNIWRKQGAAVLLCMDVNESVIKTSEKSGIGRLLTETDLIDLQHYRFPHQPRPPTYNRGQLTLDVSLGSPEFVQALRTTALLPFGQPLTLRGDHRTLILEFDQKLLFGNKPLLTPFYTTRGTNSHSLPLVQKFCRLATRAYNQSNILDNIA